jgi:tetratricopeptide (TPR) repeat protein
MQVISWEPSKRNLPMDTCRLLAPRGLAVLLAAAFVGAVCVVPAAADFASDRDLCHTFDTDKTAQKIAACTRVIKTGRLSGRNLAIAYQDRAEGYRISEKYDNALEDFERAIKIDSQIAYPYLNRAEVWRLKGNYDQVIADATQAIRLDPALNASYTIRGMAYKEIGAIAKAREDFNRALAIPVKGNDGNWAQDVARTQLKELEEKK